MENIQMMLAFVAGQICGQMYRSLLQVPDKSYPCLHQYTRYWIFEADNIDI